MTLICVDCGQQIIGIYWDYGVERICDHYWNERNWRNKIDWYTSIGYNREVKR